jgi:hypothetical protein
MATKNHGHSKETINNKKERSQHRRQGSNSTLVNHMLSASDRGIETADNAYGKSG